MTLKRMDNVLIVVDDLEAAKAFFIELGLKLEGETTVEGPAVGSLIGLKDVRSTPPIRCASSRQARRLNLLSVAGWNTCATQLGTDHEVTRELLRT